MMYRICSLLFLWCAYVQINDPDPIVWISIYLVAAGTLEMAAREGVHVLNNPQSLRDCNEKVYATEFPHCCTKHLVSSNLIIFH